MWGMTSSTPTIDSIDGGSTSHRLAARMSSTATTAADSEAAEADFDAYCTGGTGGGGVVGAREDRFSPTSVVEQSLHSSRSAPHNGNIRSTFSLFSDADYTGITSSTTQHDSSSIGGVGGGGLFCPTILTKTETTSTNGSGSSSGGSGHHHLYRPNGSICHPSDSTNLHTLTDQKFSLNGGDVNRLTSDGGLCQPLPSTTSRGYGGGGVGRGIIRCYHCRLCKKEFENKSDMQRHAKDRHRAEEKHHKCTLCQKSFPTSQQLTQHSLVHSNVRKYPCRYCDKSFKQLSHVQQHQRIHTGDRPYKCIVDGCEKAFRQLSSLQQHLKGHNIPMPKSYCISRGPSNSSADFVDRVKRMSPLARPNDLTCQVCEKLCENEERFFRHIHKYHPDYWRVFASGRPLTDYIEPQQQQQQQQRRYGQRREKRFSCSVCGKAFAQETGYAKHMAGHANGLVMGSGGHSVTRHASLDQYQHHQDGGFLVNGVGSSKSDYHHHLHRDTKVFSRLDDDSLFFPPNTIRRQSLIDVATSAGSSSVDDIKKTGRLFRPALSMDGSSGGGGDLDPLMQRYGGLFGVASTPADTTSIKYERGGGGAGKSGNLDLIQQQDASPASSIRSDGLTTSIGGSGSPKGSSLGQLTGSSGLGGATSANSPLTPMMMNGMVYGNGSSSLFPVAPTPFGCDIDASSGTGGGNDVMSSYHRRSSNIDDDGGAAALRNHFRYKFASPYHSHVTSADFSSSSMRPPTHHHQQSSSSSQQSSPLFYRQGSELGTSSDRQTSPPSPAVVDSSHRSHHRYFSPASPYLGQAGVVPSHMTSAMTQGSPYVEAARYDGALGPLNSYLQMQQLVRSLPVFR